MGLDIATVIFGSPDYQEAAAPGIVAGINTALLNAGVDPANATQAQIFAAFNEGQYQAQAALISQYGADITPVVPNTPIPASAPTTSVSPPAAPSTSATESAVPGISQATQLAGLVAGSNTPALAPGLLTQGKDTPKVLGEDYCFWYPDDPLCYDYGAGASPIGTGGSGGSTSTTIVETGLSASDVTSAIQGGLSALWSVAVGAIDVLIADVISGIQKAITALGNALLAAWQILARLAGFILNFLKSLLEDVIRGMLAAIEDVAKALKAIAVGVLPALVKAAQNIRQALIDVYQRFIRPMIIVIQDIRRILAILRLFHVNFAEKLDATLAGLEAKLTAPLFFLLSYVNGVANWINLIVTVGYLLQRPLFLNSLNAYKGSATNLVINSMNPPVDPADLQAANALNAVPSAAQTSADFTTFVETGGGPYAAPIAQNSALLQQILQQGF